jgi:hypothetical protein
MRENEILKKTNFITSKWIWVYEIWSFFGIFKRDCFTKGVNTFSSIFIFKGELTTFLIKVKLPSFQKKKNIYIYHEVRTVNKILGIEPMTQPKILEFLKLS